MDHDRPLMNTLRWILGITTVIITAGFWALICFGDGFRRSFGASENSEWKTGITLVVQIALLASIAFPGEKMVMHICAAVVLALAAGSVWVMRESAFVGVTGLTFCGMWIGYYCQAVWRIR